MNEVLPHIPVWFKDMRCTECEAAQDHIASECAPKMPATITITEHHFSSCPNFEGEGHRLQFLMIDYQIYAKRMAHQPQEGNTQ